MTDVRSSLSNDVSRCPGRCCDVRDDCARFMVAGDSKWQSQIDFSSLGQRVVRCELCHNFIPYAQEKATT